MTRQYAFFLDSSACSGCKACQAACKDKHRLPVGIMWRRVVEVTGGGWTRTGNAWTSDVFAYNLSLACNHCAHPPCVEACPARAIEKRSDGIVLIDGDKCLGCKYCSWACPYRAPQYDPHAGRMTKCTLCADEIDVGRAPACVAACPLRAMDYGELDHLVAKYGQGENIYPLPQADGNSPALVVKPHREAKRALRQEVSIGNREEVSAPTEMHEHSLVAFTVLAQAAVGIVWVASAIDVVSPNSPLALAICATMLVALVASLLHLGTPFNAWRAVANLRSSWLSREILFALLLSATATLFALSPWLKLDTYLTQQTLIWAAELFGLALVYSMAHAYRLPAVPVWNTWRTLASFMTTASVLGSWSVAAWLAIAAPTLAVISWLAGAGSILLFVQFLLTREWAKRSVAKHEQVRVVIAGMAIAAAFLTVWGSSAWALVALVLAFTSEVMGRSMFYQARNTLYG